MMSISNCITRISECCLSGYPFLGRT